jgi:hypothetical protein
VDNTVKKESTSLLPAMANVASRSGALINTHDFTNYFRDKFLVLDSMKIEISPNVYTVGPSTFFYLEYEYNSEIIRKKLKATDNKIELIVANIFTIDGIKKSIPSETKMSINYGNEIDHTKIKLGEFTLISPNSKELSKEVQIIIEKLKGAPIKEVKSNVTSYLSEFYGKVQKNNVDQWLTDNMNL